MLSFNARYYNTLPMDQAHYKAEIVNLDPAKTALVAMHCWNIGCEDGPPIDMNYYVGLGFPETSLEGGRIMKEVIRPAMDAARKAQVAVCHVESELIAKKHPEALIDQDEISKDCMPESSPNAISNWRMVKAEKVHGKNYMTASPLAKMDRAKIVCPLKGEPYVHQTGQFDRALRRMKIENLIYTGFCTDMCILRAPGGVEPMASLGYRVYLMRDATIGLEHPDTFEERLATRWAVKYFEAHFGSTLLFKDFISACEKVTNKMGQ